MDARDGMQTYMLVYQYSSIKDFGPASTIIYHPNIQAYRMGRNPIVRNRHFVRLAGNIAMQLRIKAIGCAQSPGKSPYKHQTLGIFLPHVLRAFLTIGFPYLLFPLSNPYRVCPRGVRGKGWGSSTSHSWLGFVQRYLCTKQDVN